jgi:site-specific recombinase XerD
MLKWFEEQEIALEDANIQDAMRYRNDISVQIREDGNTLGIGSIQNLLKAGKSFFRYLVNNERRSNNPFEDVPYPRLPDHISKNVLTEPQMSRLLTHILQFDAAVDGKIPSPTVQRRRYRLHVISEFLYATGLRISEAASLLPEHIDCETRIVSVVEGKGSVARFAFMTAFAADVMRLYLKRGRKAVLGTNPRRTYGHTVFGTHYERLTSLVNCGIEAVCTELELPVISSHGFRHSLGTHLLRAGCDMRHIQAILGHRSLNATQVYTRVDKDDLKNSLDAFHPRKWNGQ